MKELLLYMAKNLVDDPAAATTNTTAAPKLKCRSRALSRSCGSARRSR